jgi:hypothetical protein
VKDSIEAARTVFGGDVAAASDHLPCEQYAVYDSNLGPERCRRDARHARPKAEFRVIPSCGVIWRARVSTQPIPRSSKLKLESFSRSSELQTGFFGALRFTVLKGPDIEVELRNLPVTLPAEFKNTLGFTSPTCERLTIAGSFAAAFLGCQRQAWSPGCMISVLRHPSAIWHKDVATREARSANRARAPDSPMPGEHTNV